MITIGNIDRGIVVGEHLDNVDIATSAGPVDNGVPVIVIIINIIFSGTIGVQRDSLSDILLVNVGKVQEQ